jgi:hypothetical protein
MRLIDILSLLTAVSAAPLVSLGLLNPTMTSVQNVQGSNYSGLTPPPWITGGYYGQSRGNPWGQAYGPSSYGPYGAHPYGNGGY